MKTRITDIAERERHIDVSLIRENLKLTPLQRLQQLERLVNDLNALRAAKQKSK